MREVAGFIVRTQQEIACARGPQSIPHPAARRYLLIIFFQKHLFDVHIK